MARPLAPCGTFTAYKRHRKNGDPVDDACAEAARQQRRSQTESERAETSAKIVALAPLPPEPSSTVDEIDELAEARWNLEMVRATMQAGVPTGMAALSKQYQDLVTTIRRLETAAKPGVSKLDQLAQRRAERLSAASS